MPINILISKYKIVFLTAIVFFVAGYLACVVKIRIATSTIFEVANDDVVYADNQIQIIVRTSYRKNVLMGQPIYSIILRNKSGEEYYYVTLENTFQEPSIYPKLSESSNDNIIFTSGNNGVIKIHLPSIVIEGLNGERVYLGRQKVKDDGNYIVPHKDYPDSDTTTK